MSAGSSVTSRRPESFEELVRHISDRHGRLSARLKDIAEFAIDHPGVMALDTVAAIAEQIGAPPSALVRFAQALGFEGFSEMQKLFRQRLIEPVPSYAERLRALEGRGAGTPEAIIADFSAATVAAAEALAAALDPAALAGAASVLAGASTVHIVAQRRSFAVATYLDYALLSLGKPTALIDGRGGMGAGHARAMQPGAALLAISFKPYAPETLEVADTARRHGLPVVVVTDTPLSPLAALAEVTLLVRDPEVDRVRSLAASMTLAVMLVVATGQRLLDS